MASIISRTGRDRDAFDAQCHHLMVEDTETDNVVGTYRLQTNEMAAAGNGFYSAGEFDLTALPDDVTLNAIELGRACIAPAHRHTNVLYLLWRGIAAYTLAQRKRYLFGCCSLTSQNPLEGWAVMQQLRDSGHVRRDWLVLPQPDFICGETEESHMRLPKFLNCFARIALQRAGLLAAHNGSGIQND
ncbi:MAG: GNAT family N-acyltransferase [Blastocatellia bacterium]